MSDENKIRDAADAVKGIVEAVPVYQDVIQPAAKEVGTALQIVAKTIHIVLSPLKGLVWGYEQITAYLDAALSEKLKYVPKERIITPNPAVAVPILQSLLYTAQEPDLREMFANLLATSMDKETSKNAHPSFVELIRQLSPDEARLLRYVATNENVVDGKLYGLGFPKVSIAIHFYGDHKEPYNVSYGDISQKAGCEHHDLFHIYLENLYRLNLLQLTYSPDSEFEEEERDLYLPVKKTLGHDEASIRMQYGAGVHADYKYEFVRFTSLGYLFANACIHSKDAKDTSGSSAPQPPDPNATDSRRE